MELQHESTLEENIQLIKQALPVIIREYLESGKFTPVARTIGIKYTLTSNQTNILERELMLLLMGVENPDEFATSLKGEAMLSDDVVKSIMTDVNQEVFVPLQKEMEMIETAKTIVPPVAPQPVKPVVAATPPAPKQAPKFPEVKFEVPKRDGFYAPPPQSPSYPQVAKEESEYIFARPEQTTLNTGRAAINAASPFGKFATQRPLPVAPKNSVNLLARSGATPAQPIVGEKLLEDHEEPHIEFKSQVPANLPGTMPPPVAQIRPIPIVPSAPAKLYSTDPYREPIDEEGK